MTKREIAINDSLGMYTLNVNFPDSLYYIKIIRCIIKIHKFRGVSDWSKNILVCEADRL